MKYLSIDIETTGLDPLNDQLLSFGAIIEDTENPLPFDEIPKFHAAIKRNRIEGDLFAINMNKELIETINQYMNSPDNSRSTNSGIDFYKEDEIVSGFRQWLITNNFTQLDKEITNLTVAGKNFGTFDKLFIERLPRWKQYFRIRQRIIDPAILFVDWKNDNSLPGLSACKTRAKLNPNVTHNAVEDAWDVIELLRLNY
jgi:oligoribonuclease